MRDKIIIIYDCTHVIFFPFCFDQHNSDFPVNLINVEQGKHNFMCCHDDMYYIHASVQSNVKNVFQKWIVVIIQAGTA